MTQRAVLKKKIALAIFLLLFIAAGVLVYLGQSREKKAELYYSGIIEATQANLSFQASGRVLKMLVQEGQSVSPGEPLAQLEQDEYEARFDQAAANLGRARESQKQLETLLRLYEQSLPAEVARAEAAVQALSSQLEELQAGSRSQDVERARQAFLAAGAVMATAEKDRKRYDTLFQHGTVSEKEWEAVKLQYETAFRDYEQKKQAYDLVKEGPRRETIETARARVQEGRAALLSARSNLKRIEAAKRDVEAARLQVRASQAALDQMEIQRNYTTLKAPFAGIITSRNIEPGEAVASNSEVLTLADLSRVDLKIFVGETEIGKVKPGQKAEVKVDTYPGKVYPGTVAFISPQAEFTPKIIQTHKERVKLVYMVKVSIPNPDLELKPGMPADAWLR